MATRVANAPGLCIKHQWVDGILSGKKTWEIRGARFSKHIGPRIFLIRSGTERAVVGHAVLRQVLGPLSLEEFRSTEGLHCCIDCNTLPYKIRMHWSWIMLFGGPPPMSYTHPRGAIIWVGLQPTRLFSRTCRGRAIMGGFRVGEGPHRRRCISRGS